MPDSIVYTDRHSSADPLDVLALLDRRIPHSEGFAVAETHINGIDKFWNQAKRHLRQCNGISR